ncbi:expressed protein [Echinococcus multilocularis]|uniref:Expressed protein n=1 Tax=Echinococcus multilocularis TaxID=6211 RepID=A0A068Y8F1_ECHMU|nr:expressed protein [Echinococcus multilocularis]
MQPTNKLHVHSTVPAACMILERLRGLRACHFYKTQLPLSILHFTNLLKHLLFTYVGVQGRKRGMRNIKDERTSAGLLEEGKKIVYQNVDEKQRHEQLEDA